MRAALYRKFCGPITIEDLPDPTPVPGGVVIEVRASGLCRSDWHGWRGEDPDIVLPHVPGHELAGVIAAVGTGVGAGADGWAVGDRVTLPFCCGCGTCSTCRAGQTQICDNHFQPGFTAFGSFAEYVAIPFAETNLVRIPDGVDFPVASILGCRFVTSYRAVVDRGRVGEGDWLAVHGCGGIGLSAIQIAAARGARVIAIDVDARALALARTVGATETIDAGAVDDVASAIRDLSGGGAHVSIDALGSPTCAVNSVLCLRKQGTHVQVGLLPGGATPMPMDAVIGRELVLAGSHGLSASRYPEVLKLVTDGSVDPGLLLEHTIQLDELPVALQEMKGGGVTIVSVSAD